MVAPRPRHPTAPSPSHRTSVAATPSDREARGGVQRTEETRQLTGACEDTHLPLPQSERQRSVAQQTADRPWSLPPPLRLRPRTWPRRRRGLPRSRLRPGASPARSPPPRPSRPPSGQSPRQTRHLRRLRGRATGAGRPTGSARPTVCSDGVVGVRSGGCCAGCRCGSERRGRCRARVGGGAPGGDVRVSSEVCSMLGSSSRRRRGLCGECTCARGGRALL